MKDEEWKEIYLSTLIKKLHPKGAVLQAGFASERAAEEIQTFRPASHFIIVDDPQCADETRKWAKNYPSVTVIEGEWKRELAKLGQFDTIFYRDQDFELAHTESEAQELLEETKSTLNALEEKMSTLTIRYTDEEIEAFCLNVEEQRRHELPTFFNRLVEYGFITQEQYQRTLDKIQVAPQAPADVPKSELLHFLESVISGHTHKNSRISCTMIGRASKFDDPCFFDCIITNPVLHYEEDMMAINLPDQRVKEERLMVIERLA